MTFYYRTREGEERHYGTATEAKRAAQAYANRHHVRIEVYEGSDEPAEKRHRGGRNPHSRSYVENPNYGSYRGKYPNKINQVSGGSSKYPNVHMQSNGGTVIEVPKHQMIAIDPRSFSWVMGKDIFDIAQMFGVSTRRSTAKAYRENPSKYSQLPKGRALRKAYSATWTDIKAGIKALKQHIEPADRKAKQVAKSAAAAAEKHYVTLKIGPREHTEVFDTKAHAQAFARSAKQQGFGDAIIY